MSIARDNARTCIGCKHWGFYSGRGPWSDVTPGDAWRSSCALLVWYIDGVEVYADEFRAKLLTAQTCDKFEAVETKP